MTIAEFQETIKKIYFERDQKRGVDGCFRWLTEEVGELARALRKVSAEDTEENRAALRGEFADVLAWLTTIASMTGIDLQEAATDQYGGGCPKCESTPCACAP